MAEEREEAPACSRGGPDELQGKAEASEIVYLVLDTALHLANAHPGYGTVSERAALLQGSIGPLLYTRGSRGRTAIHRAKQKGGQYIGALNLLLLVWPEGGELPVEKQWWDQNEPSLPSHSGPDNRLSGGRREAFGLTPLRSSHSLNNTAAAFQTHQQQQQQAPSGGPRPGERGA